MTGSIQQQLKKKIKYLALLLLCINLSISCNSTKSSSSSYFLECLLDVFISELPVNENQAIGIGITGGWTDSTSHVVITSQPLLVASNLRRSEYRGHDIYMTHGRMKVDSLGRVVVTVDSSDIVIPNNLNWIRVRKGQESSFVKPDFEQDPFQLQVIYFPSLHCVETILGSTTKLVKLVKTECDICK